MRAIRFYLSSIFCAILLLSCANNSRTKQLSKLENDLANSSGLARRQIARQIFSMGKEANPLVIKLLEDSDPVVKRNAHRDLRARFGDEALQYYEKALDNEDPFIRRVAVEDLIAWQPRGDKVIALLQKSAKDKDNEIRKLAADVFWDFHRNYTPIRKRPEWDHEIDILHKQDFPIKGWRCIADRGNTGHLEGWFKKDFDDSKWPAGEIGRWWHEAMPETIGEYEGIAWYRIEFDAPAKPDYQYNEALLHFMGVDECAWVWINGEFAGEHNMGTAGWNVPFDIEVGSFLNWNAKNTLVVRVENAAGAGGIYKPVEFQIIK